MKTYLTFWLLTFIAVAQGHGTFVLWDESVNGPLSNNANTPTSFTPLQIGINSIIGAAEVEPTGPNWFSHDDTFILTVPNGSYVSSISLAIDKPNVVAWIGDTGFSSQLAAVGSSTSGNLLSQWELSMIAPGSYGMYMGNNDRQPFTSIAHYRLDFTVQAIPEPSTAVFFLTGLVALLAFKRRKSYRCCNTRASMKFISPARTIHPP